MNDIVLPRPLAIETQFAGAQRGAEVKSADLWWAAFAATLIPIGLLWDFSWESSIGADRFWSPPHLAVHVGVWLCGLLGGRLVLEFTLARRRGCPAAGVSL